MLILFKNETHVWGINARYSQIPNCLNMSGLTLNCEACSKHFSQDLFGNCEECSVNYRMSQHKNLCVYEIPHCEVYNDENGNCDKCEKGFDIIPSEYLPRKDYDLRDIQCSLVMNLEVKITVYSPVILSTNFLFDSFAYTLNRRYVIFWIIFPDRYMG